MSIVCSILCIAIAAFIIIKKPLVTESISVPLLIVLSSDVVALEYLVVSIILIYAGVFSVNISLSICLVIEAIFVFLIMRKKVGKVNIRSDKQIDWILLGCAVLFVYLFTHISSQEISSFGDMGAYFQHLILMLKGNYSSRLTIPEYGIISDTVDHNIMNMFYGSYGYWKENQWEMHGIGTWCVFPALFASMFGLYNNNIGISYLFLMILLNLLFGIELKTNSVRKCLTGGALFALSPLMIYLGKTNLAEICTLFIISVWFILVDFEKKEGVINYFAAFTLGLWGFVHVNAMLYTPLILICVFVYGMIDKSTSKKCLTTNAIVGVMFSLALFYEYKIAPSYTIRQFGVISNRLQISTILCFIILISGIGIGLLTEFIIYKKQPRWSDKLALFFDMHYKYVFLVADFLILIFCIYYGYNLCFTDNMKVDEIDYATSTWIRRNEYANSGISALSYLNITNIFRATGVVGLLIFFIIPFVVKNIKVSERILYLFTMCTLVLCTTYLWDTPINYYGSRYLAVCVLLVVMCDGLIVSDKAILSLMTVIMLIMTKPYIPSLISCATHYGQYEVLRDTLDEIKPDMVVFFEENDTDAASLLLHDLRVINRNKCFNLLDYEEVYTYYGDEMTYYIVSSKDWYSDISRKLLDKKYISLYSLGNGGGGIYGKMSGEYTIPLYIYEVRGDL